MLKSLMRRHCYQARKQHDDAERGPVAEIAKTACEKEEDKGSWRVFHGDLVSDIAHMALGEDRDPRVITRSGR